MIDNKNLSFKNKINFIIFKVCILAS